MCLDYAWGNYIQQGESKDTIFATGARKNILAHIFMTCHEGLDKFNFTVSIQKFDLHDV